MSSQTRLCSHLEEAYKLLVHLSKFHALPNTDSAPPRSDPKLPDSVAISGKAAFSMESVIKKAVPVTISVRFPRESRKRISSQNRTDSLMDSYANFKSSGVPDRVMWYDGEDWVDLEGEVLERVRLGFGEGRVVVEGEVGGLRCLLDFLRMVLVEFGSGRRRSVAWIDVAGKCFFPKAFVVDDDGFEDEVENVRIGIEVSLGDECKLGKRKRGVEVEVDNVEVRDVREYSGESQSSNRVGGRRELVKHALEEADAGVAKWRNCRLMRDGERGCRVVKSLFLAKVRTVDPGVEVRSVCSFVRNEGIGKTWSLAFNRCVQLTTLARGRANVVFAWYGATAEGVGRIMAHRFGMPCDVKESHGVGFHLHPISLPHLSVMELEPDENGEKHAILCRVVLGNVEKVEAGSKQRCPTSTKFDNGVDDLTNPRQYIVWGANMNTHILPECVVSFKSSGHVSGEAGISSVVHSSHKVPLSSVPLSLLMSQLPKYLPSTKANEIIKLHNAFKAGRVTKADFGKGACAIAGDRVIYLALSSVVEMTNKK